MLPTHRWRSFHTSTSLLPTGHQIPLGSEMVASLPGGTRGEVGLPRAGSHTWVLKCVSLPTPLTAVEKLSKVPGGAGTSVCLFVSVVVRK